jgi:hypothetical protein
MGKKWQGDYIPFSYNSLTKLVRQIKFLLLQRMS